MRESLDQQCRQCFCFPVGRLQITDYSLSMTMTISFRIPADKNSLSPPPPTTRPNLDVDKSGGNSGFGLCASHVRSTDSSWRATDGGRLKRGQSSKGVRVMA